MAGMSQKLTSLVKAVPQLTPYVLTNLGKNLARGFGPDRGFIGRVENLRKQIARSQFDPFSFLAQTGRRTPAHGNCAAWRLGKH